MIAEITEDGILNLIAEDTTDCFALKQWKKLFDTAKNKKKIITIETDLKKIAIERIHEQVFMQANAEKLKNSINEETDNTSTMGFHN